VGCHLAANLSGVTPKTLDHVALWVTDRDTIAERCERDLGMHVIDRTDRFTLMGSDARRGKLTLFDAEGPREQGALKHVALRVSSGEDRELDLGEGLKVKVLEAPTDVDYDLDHVALYSADPEATAADYEAYGFRAAASRDGVPRVEVGGAFVEFHHGVLVDSADDHIDAAKELGIEIDDVVDAANTYAVFLWGPERVRIEYVEHKPTFSLV
jgi:catechol 2,3-dioxygenase-like lactoylglutathione lyase family enzyme